LVVPLATVVDHKYSMIFDFKGGYKVSNDLSKPAATASAT
jgi:hypothetical protein